MSLNLEPQFGDGNSNGFFSQIIDAGGSAVASGFDRVTAESGSIFKGLVDRGTAKILSDQSKDKLFRSVYNEEKAEPKYKDYEKQNFNSFTSGIDTKTMALIGGLGILAIILLVKS